MGNRDRLLQPIIELLDTLMDDPAVLADFQQQCVHLNAFIDFVHQAAYVGVVPEPDPNTEVKFRHGPLMGEVECDEWIGATIRKLPKGALAKLYRILHDAEGINLDNAKSLERTWREAARKA